MPTQPDEHAPSPHEAEQGALRLLGPALFGAWHRGLTAIAGAFVRLGRAVAALWRAWSLQWVRVREYHAAATRPWQQEDTRVRETAAAVGIRAFVVGVVLAGLAAADSRSAAMAGVATILTELLWAGARFIIIAMLMPRGAIDRPRLSVAFLAGLLPYLFGTTAALRVISLLASAYLTRRGLLGAGVPRLDADRALGWSFGGQVVVIAGGWLVRALLALVVGV